MDRPADVSRRVRTAAVATIVAILILASAHITAFGEVSEQPGFQKLFHLVGVPGLRRDERVDVVPNSDGLVFQTKKVQYQVPYARIRQILILHADRRYEGRTYAAAVATYGVGSLFILKKHHVDTVVLDYVNERGGKMGIVVQMEPEQGEQFKSLMQSRGASVEEPEGLPETPAAGASATEVTKGSTK